MGPFEKSAMPGKTDILKVTYIILEIDKILNVTIMGVLVATTKLVCMGKNRKMFVTKEVVTVVRLLLQSAGLSDFCCLSSFK